MESKVNPILKLTNNGHTVKGAGPITNWDPAYEVSAVFGFAVVQAQPTGATSAQLAIATGAAPKRYKPSDTNWSAMGKVPAGDPALQTGAAVVYARAWIEYIDGELEPYDWEVHVVLQ
jgi:hypothetical protein